MSVSAISQITCVGTVTAGSVRASAAFDWSPDQVESQPRALMTRARPPSCGGAFAIPVRRNKDLPGVR
jgi:hypothetical protein